MKSLIALVALTAAMPVAWAQNSSEAIVTPGVDKLKADNRAAPDAAAPVIRPLPDIAPPVTIAPTRPQIQPLPATPTPAAPTPAPRAERNRREQPPPSPAEPAAPYGGMTNTAAPDAAPLSPDANATIDNGAINESAGPLNDAAPVESATDWTPWLIGGGAAVLAILALLLRRRRRAPKDLPPMEEAPAAEAAPAPLPDTDAPLEPPAPAPRRTEEDRPTLVIGFTPQSARVTLVGAAVGYRLTIENKGPRAAEDVMLTGILTNADAQQQAILASFFASASEMVGDVIGRIEPGQILDLEGEMRIGHERITPVEVEGMKLLIPVVALNLRYQWTRDQRIDKGSGRNGAAFIVGQESDPPREKMAPFRMDQGPRQYRAVGARLAQNPVSD